jgi:hypothetical protein
MPRRGTGQGTTLLPFSHTWEKGPGDEGHYANDTGHKDDTPCHNDHHTVPLYQSANKLASFDAT